jgi:hypothetical protein
MPPLQISTQSQSSTWRTGIQNSTDIPRCRYQQNSTYSTNQEYRYRYLLMGPCNRWINVMEAGKQEEAFTHSRRYSRKTNRVAHLGDSLTSTRSFALELASKIIQILNINRVVYHTDSQLLARNINSQDPILVAPDWRIRPSVAQFIYNNTNTDHI